MWFQIASVMFALYSLAAWLTLLATPAASRTSARYPNSTVSIAFAGVKKATAHPPSAHTSLHSRMAGTHQRC